MHNWFECKIKYDKIDEYGKEKPVSESYVVDALSFTEAEGRLVKMLEGEIPDEFIVTGITKAKLDEIVPDEDADYWYKCKVMLKDIDEKSGKEKKIQSQVLVAADDFRGALESAEKSLEQVLVPWEIHQIALTKIVDVMPYAPEDATGQTDANADLSETDKDYIGEQE